MSLANDTNTRGVFDRSISIFTSNTYQSYSDDMRSLGSSVEELLWHGEPSQNHHTGCAIGHMYIVWSAQMHAKCLKGDETRWGCYFHSQVCVCLGAFGTNPGSKASWTHVGPKWSRRDPRWPSVGPTQFVVGVSAGKSLCQLGFRVCKRPTLGWKQCNRTARNKLWWPWWSVWQWKVDIKIIIMFISVDISSWW